MTTGPTARKSAAVLPPPAATLARLVPQVRLATAPAGAVVHVLTATVTRCGRKTAAGWDLYAGTPPEPPAPPAARLCPRCLAGLPLELRRQLVPTAAELGAVHELVARTAVEDVRHLLANLREEALVDGSAWERTTLTVAALNRLPAVPRGARPLTKAERGAHVSGYVATEREVTLLELLNVIDPSRPDLPNHRVWFVDPPAPGTAVQAGATYDARLWMGRKR